MPSGLTQDGILVNFLSDAAQQAPILTFPLDPFNRGNHITEDIQEGFVFVVGKFSCIQKHAVLFASLVFKMLLLRVFEFFHGFPQRGHWIFRTVL